MTETNGGAPGGRPAADRTPDPAPGDADTEPDGPDPGPEAGFAGGTGSGAGADSAGDAAGGGDPRVARDYATEELERELTVFFRRARSASGEMAREVHPELEPAAYGLLVRLAEAEPERATDLAGYFGVGKATMSRQLRALEQLGLVARESDPADGRAFLMRLTDEGRERFSHVRTARRDRYLRQLASWRQADIAELSRLLHLLNDVQLGDSTP